MVTIDGAKALSTLPPGGFEEVGLEMTMGSKLASMPRGSCGVADKAVIVCECKVDIHSLTSICAPLSVSTAPRNVPEQSKASPSPCSGDPSAAGPSCCHCPLPHRQQPASTHAAWNLPAPKSRFGFESMQPFSSKQKPRSLTLATFPLTTTLMIPSLWHQNKTNKIKQNKPALIKDLAKANINSISPTQPIPNQRPT